MILLYLLLLVAASAQAGESGATVTSFRSNGETIGTAEAWVIAPLGKLITSRSALRGAARAEATLGTVTYPVAVVDGDDEDLDAVELQIATVAPVAAVEMADLDSVPAWQKHDVPGAGDVAKWESGEGSSRAILKDGKLAGFVRAFEVDGKRTAFVVPAERLRKLSRAGSLSVSEWSTKAVRPALLEEVYTRGLLAVWTGDHRSAEQYFEQAIRQDAKYARAWFQLGYARAKLGKQRDKIEAFRHAVEARPDFADAQYSLAMAYILSGDRRSALAIAQKLKTIDPDMSEKLMLVLDNVHVDTEKPAPPKPKRPSDKPVAYTAPFLASARFPASSTSMMRSTS